MKSRLSKPQIDYVLEHLGHHASLRDVAALFRFGSDPEPGTTAVYFPLSQEGFQTDRVIYIKDVPVLYPVNAGSDAPYTFKGSNLVFHHDLLKSAFHLLSGYEEMKNWTEDQFGRFPYQQSIQYKLGIAGKPVVNYYFEIILDGISEFARKNNIPFNRDPVFKRGVLMLSHDVDLIGGYSFFDTGFRFKQLLGLADSRLTLRHRMKDSFTALFHFLNPFSRKDPYWTFDNLTRWASERGFRSTYFLLEKEGGRHMNSRYHFHDKKIRKLMRELSAGDFEVGLHGTVQSATDQQAMDRTMGNLQEAAPEPVTGVRQHYLKFKLPDTALIQKNAGLTYDASLGFAEHEGFRNSYCWPFKFYDFTNDRPVDFWEIPLTAMEVTLFYYRELDFDGIRESIENLVREVQKFNGVFSLLWHNSFFEEMEFPGITDFYQSLLDLFHSLGLEGITGKEIVDRMRLVN